MLRSLDAAALAFSVVVFGLAVGVAWLFKQYRITDSAGLIVVIVLPFVAYGIASGFVAKVSLPGGFAAEFRQIAAAKISPTLIGEVTDVLVVEKQSISSIPAFRDRVQPGKPIAISLQLGLRDYYNGDAIIEYLRTFQTLDPDLTVIFVENATGVFVASANANSVLAAVQVREFQQDFLGALENADQAALSRLVALTTATVTAATTNAEALQRMTDDGVDAIIKVDEAGKAKGLVRRDEILSRLMLTLASGG